MNARSFGDALSLQADRLLRGGVGERRLLGRHRAVQVRAPRPAFAPVADRAVGIALPRFAERAHRVEARERVHHLEALVEKRLRFLVLGWRSAGGTGRGRWCRAGMGSLTYFGNFSGSIEVTLLSPARRGAGYETTKTADRRTGTRERSSRPPRKDSMILEAWRAWGLGLGA